MYQCMIDLFAVTCILYVGQLMCTIDSIFMATFTDNFYFYDNYIYKLISLILTLFFTIYVHDIFSLRQFMGMIDFICGNLCL